jgi:hypothetical protein
VDKVDEVPFQHILLEGSELLSDPQLVLLRFSVVDKGILRTRVI